MTAPTTSSTIPTSAADASPVSFTAHKLVRKANAESQICLTAVCSNTHPPSISMLQLAVSSLDLYLKAG